MGGQRAMALMAVVVGSFLAVPVVFAADGDLPEAPTTAEVNYDEIRAAIEAETDPELKQLMQEQLALLETGQLDLGAESGHEVARIIPGQGASDTTQPVGHMRPGTELIGPPIEIGTGGQQGPGDYLPAEARDRLEKLFQEKGTGDPAQDANIREEAERILLEYGIDPREMGSGHEGEWERGEMPEGVFERMSPEALEHMSPEAREQLERVFESQETEHPETYREIFEREYFGTEPRETEFRTYEAPTHEYEASTHEYEPSAQEQEYHEYGAPEQFTPEQQTPPQP